MKNQQKSALIKLTPQELVAKRAQLQTDLVKTLSELKLGKLKNVKQGKNIRYQIAFINTLLTQTQHQSPQKEA